MSFATPAAISGSRPGRSEAQRCGRVGKQMLAELSDGPAGDAAVDVAVEGVEKRARQLVALGRQQRLLDEGAERQVREHGLRCHALPRVGGCQSCQSVARLLLVRLRHDLGEGAEGVAVRGEPHA